MKIYRIQIGRYTRKQKFEQLNEIIVKSDEELETVRSAYSKKYEGFNVTIEEIKEIKIFKKEKEETEIKTVKTSVRKIEREHGYNSPDKYTAIIPRGDIQEWDEWELSIKNKQRELDKVRKEFNDKIVKKFKLRQVNNLVVMSDGVRFDYYGRWFDFKGELKK